MEKSTATKIAYELFDKHGMSDWTFGFHSRRNSCGTCWPDKKLIQLSIYHLLYSTDEEIRDTLLHEIAHALDYIRNRERGHGPSWKAICVEIGARPERCKTSEWFPGKTKYDYYCTGCEAEWHVNRRLKTGNRCCAHCRTPVSKFNITRRW